MSDSNLGRFIWYELLTRSTESSRSFYQRLLDWGHTSWEGEGFTYEMFLRGEQPYAGMVELPEEAQAQGAPSHWMGYLYVPDRDAAVEQAVAAGATKYHQMEVPEVGRFAILGDPQGAAFAAYTPDNEPGPEAEADTGQVSWHELATTDLDAAWSFYSTMFGWDLMDDMDMGEQGTYRIFGRNGRQLGGMYRKPPEMPMAAWLYYFKTPSCDAAVARVAELGGRVVNGPMEVPGGDRVLHAADPAGGMFALHSVEAQETEA